MSKEWLKAAGMRAVKTFCQTGLTMITVGQAVSDVDWIGMVSISAVAAVASIMTSVITGLPEVNTESEE
ncbi:MAG: holin [Lachnospiraceae bacterium]